MKALGITAMILAIVAVFIPVLGPYVTILAAIMAAFAGGPGVTFGVVALILNVVNIVALSPSLWIAAGGHEILAPGTENAAIWAGKFLVGVQIVAGIVLVAVHSSTRKNETQAATAGKAGDAKQLLIKDKMVGSILLVLALLWVMYNLFSSPDTKPQTEAETASTTEGVPKPNMAVGPEASAAFATESEPEPDTSVEQTSSKWRLESELDAMDDTQNIRLLLDADDPVRLWPPTPTLEIRCVKNKTHVLVITGEPAGTIGENSARVRLRFDGGKPTTSYWTASTNFMALFAPNPIALAKEIASTSELALEYQPMMSAAVVAKFSTAGLNEKLTWVSSACHWKEAP